MELLGRGLMVRWGWWEGLDGKVGLDVEVELMGGTQKPINKLVTCCHPSPLPTTLPQLFHLVANSYKTVCKATELKSRGIDIWWTFVLLESVSVCMADSIL